MRLVTQNVRGLTPEKLEMIIHTMKDRGIHAAALQEAWAAVPSGRDNDETDGFLIIWNGETVCPCNRGRLGIVPVNNDRLLAAVLAGTRLCRRHEAPFHNLSTTCPDGVRTGRRNRL